MPRIVRSTPIAANPCTCSIVAPRREHHRLVCLTSHLSAQLGDTGAHVATEMLSTTVQNADGATKTLDTEQVLFLRQ